MIWLAVATPVEPSQATWTSPSKKKSSWDEEDFEGGDNASYNWVNPRRSKKRMEGEVKKADKKKGKMRDKGMNSRIIAKTDCTSLSSFTPTPSTSLSQPPPPPVDDQNNRLPPPPPLLPSRSPSASHAQELGLHWLIKDLLWMDDFTVLWDQYPSPFEPESADSEKWLGDARDWLEELAGFLKPPSYNPDKDLKELLILSKQEIDCPGDHVVTGEAVLKTLSGLGNWIELVFVHSTSLAEISKELMELKAWSTACKLIVSV